MSDDDFKTNADAITTPSTPEPDPAKTDGDDGHPRPAPGGTINSDKPYPHPS